MVAFVTIARSIRTSVAAHIFQLQNTSHYLTDIKIFIVDTSYATSPMYCKEEIDLTPDDLYFIEVSDDSG